MLPQDRVAQGYLPNVMAKLVKSGECSNAIQIQKKLATDENTLISPNTIRRALRRQGLVARVKKKETPTEEAA